MDATRHLVLGVFEPQSMTIASADSSLPSSSKLESGPGRLAVDPRFQGMEKKFGAVYYNFPHAGQGLDMRDNAA